MLNIEKYITIKTMSELLAYEIYHYSKIDKIKIKDIELIYNTLSSHLIFKDYKNEIITLGKSMAKILYNVNLQ